GQYKNRAIGILLSGNAHDGADGLKAIKNEGGITFVQDDTAKFKNMPGEAISQGLADFILPPAAIGKELKLLSKHPCINDFAGADDLDLIDGNSRDFQNLIELLYKKTGNDFNQYKMPTIKRRILRRMLLHKITSLRTYNRLLNQNEAEIKALYQDMLINVTAFFREEGLHLYLKTTILPRLLKDRNITNPLRIWVPACSTGEEAYSLAISLLELKSKGQVHGPLQIFATDLSEQAISKARAGIYSRQDLHALSSKQLQTFFTKHDETNYRISKEVRELCVFAPHNLLQDPPFSRVDLISCCNLFIYLTPAAQKRTISLFHYALNNNGFLVLGKSETIGAASPLFSDFNKKLHVYSRKASSDKRDASVISQRQARPIFALPNPASLRKKPSIPAGTSLDRTIDNILLSQYIPASVVINYDMEIQQFRGLTSLFFEPSTGKASLNVLKMTRPEIVFELRSAIQKAIQNKTAVRKKGIELRLDAMVQKIALEVVPLQVEWDEPLLLILFTPETSLVPYESPSDKASSLNPKDRRVKKLEEELAAIRMELRLITQEQENANEALQSANEEIISNNEELQSINEELETSKEEVDATNEELISANQELQNRNEMLVEAYNYSEAIISTIHEPMLVLDERLHIKSANPSFYRKFNVHEKETIGISLYELGNKQWNIASLRKLLEDVRKNNKQFNNYKVVHTFPGIGKKVMMLNANSIIQKGQRRQLILLAIADITDQTLDQLHEREIFYESINRRKVRYAMFKKELEEEILKIQNFSEKVLQKKEADTEPVRQGMARIRNSAAKISVLIEKHNPD
ncbi:MAG TPA: CheR family methyltransferase, partial [Bacteroidia bacterium]|nr:CheR family methyltransferase [Bacteroidia bacterium]